jgi:YrbI family 3-deoxy-D-manno-octulosonate 8-phosphate phosphatase
MTGPLNREAIEVYHDRIRETILAHLPAHELEDQHRRLAETLEATGLADEQVAFMGDDIIDIPLLRRVGFAAAPADAVGDVFPFAHFVAKNRGGWGAVREVCDLILKAQCTWDTVTSRYYV